MARQSQELFRFSVMRPPEMDLLEPAAALNDSARRKAESAGFAGDSAADAKVDDVPLYTVAAAQLTPVGEKPAEGWDSIVDGIAREPAEGHEWLTDVVEAYTGTKGPGLDLARIRAVVANPKFGEGCERLYRGWVADRLGRARRAAAGEGKPASLQDSVGSGSKGPIPRVIIDRALRLAALLRVLSRKSELKFTPHELSTLKDAKPRVPLALMRTRRGTPRTPVALNKKALELIDHIRQLTTWINQDAGQKKAPADPKVLHEALAGNAEEASLPNRAFAVLLRKRDLLARYVASREVQRVARELLRRPPSAPGTRTATPPTASERVFTFASSMREFFGAPPAKAKPQRGAPDRGEVKRAVDAAFAHIPLDYLGLKSRPLGGQLKEVDYSSIPEAAERVSAAAEEEACDTLRQLSALPPSPIYEPVLRRIIACESGSSLGRRRATREAVLDELPYRVLGFQDLLRATEEPVDNDARELSYIENVAGGEERERVHVLTETTETETQQETEEETQESRDLQLSSQFSLQSETQRQMQKELSLDAGLSVSASYGPAVTIEANVNVHYGMSESQSQKDATNFAKNVVDQSLTSMKRRVRQLSRSRTVRTTEERNRHLFTSGAASSNIYFWVERIKRLTLKLYGKRLLLEFVVPEPGAYLAYNYLNARGKDVPPVEFQCTAAEINDTNYLQLAHLYGATGIGTPPAEFLTVSGTAKEVYKDSAVVCTNVEIKVPSGYVPQTLRISGISYIFGNPYIRLGDILIRWLGTDFADYRIEDGNGNEWKIPVPQDFRFEVDAASNSMYVFVGADESNQQGTLAVSANCTLVCARSCRLYRQWQIDTHDKIYTAYRAAVQGYEERVQASPRANVPGASPLVNREVEKQELKRIAISILSGEPPRFDLFPAFGTEDENAPPEMPEMNQIPLLRESLDRFEESLEWKQSIFKLYPSFWGGANEWLPRARFTVADIQHRAFLEAGAARLVVPVMPGREWPILRWLFERDHPLFQSFAPLDDAGSPVEVQIEDVWPAIVRELPPELPLGGDPEWIRVLVDTNDDLTRGNGTIAVTKNSAKVKVDVGLLARPQFSVFDVGREVWIDAQEYTIVDVSRDGVELTLSAKYPGNAAAGLPYVVGARTVGKPWLVRVPTDMVVLSQFRDKIHP